MLLLVDQKISDVQLKTLTTEFANLVKQYTDTTPMFFVQREDYTSVPTEADSDGDLKPTKKYLTALTDTVHSKYGTYGVDSVVMLVHRDNWVFDGVWGSNFSNTYRQYHVHLCRFDNRNEANSLGTLYHEWMHSLDALISTHTGVEIDNYFTNSKCFADWDATVVHGNKYRDCKDTPYTYIRWKDNTDALAMIAPDLRAAYQARKELYNEPYKKVMVWAITQLRALLNVKNGVPRQ